MRGIDDRSSRLFSYVDLQDRGPSGHPFRAMRDLVNPALVALDAQFAALYKEGGRPSIAPERQLMELLDFDLLFRWFVGLGVDDAVCDARHSRRTGRAF